MKTSTRRSRSLVGACLLATVALVACASSAAPGPATTAPPDTLAGLKAAIGEPVCTSDAQCRTVAVGARACGGPEGFLAWSTTRGNADTIDAAAARHAAAQREADSRSGRMSTCIAVTDPGAACIANRCTLRSAGASH